MKYDLFQKDLNGRHVLGSDFGCHKLVSESIYLFIYTKYLGGSLLIPKLTLLKADIYDISDHNI